MLLCIIIITWGVTPMLRVAGGMLRPRGMEMSAKLVWRLCDHRDSQERFISSMVPGRLRITVLFLYWPRGSVLPSSSGMVTPNGPGLGPLPTMKNVSGWLPGNTRCLIIRVWLSRAITSPLRAPCPDIGPSTAGPGMFFLSVLVTTTRPIIFCNKSGN